MLTRCVIHTHRLAELSVRVAWLTDCVCVCVSDEPLNDGEETVEFSTIPSEASVLAAFVQKSTIDWWRRQQRVHRETWQFHSHLIIVSVLTSVVLLISSKLQWRSPTNILISPSNIAFSIFITWSIFIMPSTLPVHLVVCIRLDLRRDLYHAHKLWWFILIKLCEVQMWSFVQQSADVNIHRLARVNC